MPYSCTDRTCSLGSNTSIDRLVRSPSTMPRDVVIDCPDPEALAGFYSELVGLPITYRSDDWVVVSVTDRTSGVAFQRAPDHRPPAWPDPARPQQFHLDVMVDDLDAADAQVVDLG